MRGHTTLTTLTTKYIQDGCMPAQLLKYRRVVSHISRRGLSTLRQREGEARRRRRAGAVLSLMADLPPRRLAKKLLIRHDSSEMHLLDTNRSSQEWTHTYRQKCVCVWSRQ
eukprot:scaffold10223_cov96-Skeletonema_dohrnii-CCMP3373.AAC.7